MPFRRGCPKRFWLIALIVSGCRPEERRTVVEDSAEISSPGDSLVTSNAAGVEIWFTLVRRAKGADGKQCVERGLEIRRGGTRVQVPLLYTGDPPMLLNDSTMRAVLWTHCRPIDAYLVDLRSGRPMRERAGSKS